MKSWVSNKKGIHVAVQSDNTTAISYVYNMGGMHSKSMDSLSKSIWEWCLERQIFLTAFHLPGSENIQADIGSRVFSDTTEWMLKKQIFQRLISHFFKHNINLFASRLNHQLRNYVS